MNQRSWRLRRAAPEDAAAVAMVAAASFLDAFYDDLEGADMVAYSATANAPEKFARWIADPSSIVTLAEFAATRSPIGYSVLIPPDLPIATGKSDIELKRIYTLSRFQGSGLGNALMDTALNDARAMGRSRLLLGVYGKNLRARAFYERHCFTPIGERSFPVGAAVHQDVVYARRLYT
jgi:ribosomal protein S18 acetylase RimI-like enzyme